MGSAETATIVPSVFNMDDAQRVRETTYAVMAIQLEQAKAAFGRLRAKAIRLERERDGYDIFVREVQQAIADVIVSAAPIMPDSPFAPLLALDDKLYDLVVNKKWPTTSA